MGDRRWDAGTTSYVTGDVTTGYVQARQHAGPAPHPAARPSSVQTGVARMIEVDGGNVLLSIPAGKLEA